ncbi:hypothetical protein EVAR_90713_1 [Eumeta japonica]|uniref:Uncharacterized protein n=1 Tax=Eumeta variegata TaxID=151549 RepID=A0A4C1SFA5_EUMVA|nr:hypothetical protein EVAR_90713_1 [Eumeta japonica]
MRGPTTARRSTVWGRGPRRSLYPISGTRAGEEIAEIHGRGDERGMQGHGEPGMPSERRCAGQRRAFRTPSFLVAGAQAHEAYRTIAFVYGQTEEAYFANRADPLAIHVHHWVVIFQLLVSTIEFVFDGANLSLFLTPQQCTRARARLASLDRRSRLSGEHEDHIIRERLHVYAEFPSSRVGNPGSGSKGWTGYRTLYTTLEVPFLHSSSVLDDYLPVPKVASDQAMEVHRQPRARSWVSNAGHHALYVSSDHKGRPPSALRREAILRRLKFWHCATGGGRPASFPLFCPAQEQTYRTEQSQIPENGSLAYVRGEPINARGLSRVECFKSKPNLSPGKRWVHPGQIPRSFGWLTTPVGSPSDFRMIRIVSIDTVIREKVSARRVADSSGPITCPESVFNRTSSRFFRFPDDPVDAVPQALHPVQSKTVSSSWSAPQPLPFRKLPSLHIPRPRTPLGPHFGCAASLCAHLVSAPLTRDSTRGFSPRVFELYVEWQRRKLVGCIRCKSQQPRRVGRTSPQISPSRLVYQREAEGRIVLHRTANVTALWSEDVTSRTTCHPSALSSRAELHAVTSTTLLRRRSPIHLERGRIALVQDAALRIEEVAEIDTARIIAFAAPPYTPRADIAPRMILSVPSFEQTYRTRSSCDVFAVEGLILFDVHVAAQDIMAALTGPSAEPSLDDSAPRVPSQLANIPNIGFLNNGYRIFALQPQRAAQS